MSQLIIPALALGGVYVLYESMTKKRKHSSHSSSSSSSSSSSNSKSRRSKDKSSSSSSSSSPSSRFSKKIRVHKNKTVKKKSSQKEITVYYTYGSVKGKKWLYKHLPSGWKLKVKKNINHDKYTKHVVFSGPKKNRDKMEKYLEDAFKYLKQMNIVRYYKVSRS